MGPFGRAAVLACVAVLAGVPSAALGQSAVFVVRHAERADTDVGGPGIMTEDPDLSANGRARAELLARILRDAAVTHIFVTERRRTRQTAAPLAKALGIAPVQVGSRDVPGLAERLKGLDGNALVVGHSNTVAEIVEALGAPRPREVDDTEFDHLFVVVRASPPGVVHLRY